MCRLFLSSILCLFVLHIGVFAQEVKNSPAQTQQWKRLESENKEFALALPASFDVLVDPEGFWRGNPLKVGETFLYKDLRSVRAYKDGVAIILERYKVENSKRALLGLISNEPSLSTIAEGDVKDFDFEGFSIRQRIKENEHSYLIKLHLASDKYIYFIIVGARSKNNPLISQFLGQIEVAGKQLFPQSEKIQNKFETVVPISDLQSSPFEGITENALEKQETQNPQPQTLKNEIKPKPAMPDLTAKPLMILFQPPPGYTEKARRNAITGIILLRLTFKADGQINKAEVINGLPDGLNEKAFNSVRRTLFLPVIKQGAPTPVTRQVEYKFVMY